MKHLKLYTAVRLIRRKGSIRKAAEVLAVSPSALNRSIQNFEDAIGVEIFERVPTGVRLTPAGELLIDVVERHLVEFEELQRQVGNLRDGQTGRLRVALSDDIAAGLPLLAIRDVEDEMPGVSVDVTGGDPLSHLRRRQVDLAITTTPETTRQMQVLASQTVPLVAAGTSAWVDEDAPAGIEAIGLWDLVRARLVLPPEGTGARAALAHAMRRHTLDEGVATSVTAAHLGATMANGARVCVFPRSVFDAPGLADTVHPLPLDIGSVQISVLRLAGVPLTKPAQRLLHRIARRLDAGA